MAEEFKYLAADGSLTEAGLRVLEQSDPDWAEQLAAFQREIDAKKHDLSGDSGGNG